ncbi:MAG: radical SAM protein [Syntrophorhabdaceae bacterium]
MDIQRQDQLARLGDLFNLRRKQVEELQVTSPFKQINADCVKKGGNLISPMAVMIDLTSACNQNCVFCYRSGPSVLMPDGKPKFLELDNLGKICSQLKESNVVSLTLTGGEPTLHPDFIEAVRMVKEFGFFLTIVTNGSHVAEKDIDKLALLLDPEYDRVELSFNAATAQVFQHITRIDAYPNLLRTLKRFRERGIPFVTMTLILNENKHQIDEIVEIAAAHGAQECAVEVPFPKRNMPKTAYASMDAVLEIHERLCRRTYGDPKIQLNFMHLAMNFPGGLEALKSSLGYDGRLLSSCHGGTSSCALDINGNMHMCQFLIDTDGCVAGNINEEGFPALWRKLQKKKDRMITQEGAEGCLGFAIERCDTC